MRCRNICQVVARSQSPAPVSIGELLQCSSWFRPAHNPDYSREVRSNEERDPVWHDTSSLNLVIASTPVHRHRVGRAGMIMLLPASRKPGGAQPPPPKRRWQSHDLRAKNTVTSLRCNTVPLNLILPSISSMELLMSRDDHQVRWYSSYTWHRIGRFR